MKDNTPANKSVLVTGSSSGIGKTIAVYLAARGYTVLAAVRRDSAVEALKSLKKLQLLFLNR
jgi:NAD(P)-dependent dehydrogenase (short-subunit alcohol dehydrogenase family)